MSYPSVFQLLKLEGWGCGGMQSGAASLRFWDTVCHTHSDCHLGPEAGLEACVSLTHVQPHHLRPMGDRGSAWLSLVPSPPWRALAPSSGPSPSQPPGASRTKCPAQGVLAGTCVHLSLVCKRKTDPSPELHKDIFEIWFLLQLNGKTIPTQAGMGIKWEGNSLKVTLGQSAY